MQSLTLILFILGVFLKILCYLEGVLQAVFHKFFLVGFQIHCVFPTLPSCKSAICNIISKYSVSLRIPSEDGKIRTRKSLNTDSFHAVLL